MCHAVNMEQWWSWLQSSATNRERLCFSAMIFSWPKLLALDDQTPDCEQAHGQHPKFVGTWQNHLKEHTGGHPLIHWSGDRHPNPCRLPTHESCARLRHNHLACGLRQDPNQKPFGPDTVRQKK